MQTALALRDQSEIVAQEFPKFTDWEWTERKNERDFLQGIKGMVHAKVNGDDFDRQVKLYKMGCMDIIDADRADHVIALAKKHRLKTVRHFRNYPITGNKEFRIEGNKKFDWLIKPVNNFEEKIPLRGLETLTFLRQNGVDPDDFSVGVAVPKPIPKPPPAVDPVLLMHFGQYVIEIFRWG